MSTRVCWVPRCGWTNTRRYLNLHACDRHTPAKVRDRYGSPWPEWDGKARAELVSRVGSGFTVWGSGQ
jgi:hypothetical protein